MKLEQLHELGFDKSESIQPDNGVPCNFVSCSQCDALVINGTPTHETGCPNDIKAQEERHKYNEQFQETDNNEGANK
jgi:hypothetical protein